MITILNRAELTTTFSTEEQSKISTMLAGAGIDYRIKVVDRNSPSPFGEARRGAGTLGQNLELTYEYIFYVRKNDYAQARKAIGGA